jgi:hypothetical protein
VRIVTAFTGDAASHDAALRPGLRHPDRLVVESSQHSLCGHAARRIPAANAAQARAAWA